ncbi:MAG: bifunctional folylpolyglutamate synthase/dihydrofolate synthase [Flavobacteriales bacterium]
MSKTAYERAVDALFTQLPMFQRQGPAAYKADLGATRRVCQALGNPEKALRVVHVAGTNGKGTVCHMVAAVLQEAGFRVGLFTSPHLVDFRERIRVNGVCIPEASVVDFVGRWQKAEGAWGTPSFFELTFGMALDHFRDALCDVVVLETGMGGRLDSTNVIPAPEVTCVTNVGLDHQAFLGNDVPSIAREKAGIFKDGVPVVLGPMRPEALSEMLSASLKTSSEVHYARDVETDLRRLGLESDSPVDRVNMSTAFAVLRVLTARGWKISPESTANGLRNHQALTGQRGRWQRIVMPKGPEVILDGAHNADGVRNTLAELHQRTEERGGHLWVVWGAVGDKDPSPVMSLLPVEARFVWCAADIPRAMNPTTLSHVRPELEGHVSSTAVLALTWALEQSGRRDVIWVGGSLFVVGDVLREAPSKIEGWPLEEEGIKQECR